jgi:hypothetical protein
MDGFSSIYSQPLREILNLIFVPWLRGLVVYSPTAADKFLGLEIESRQGIG